MTTKTHISGKDAALEDSIETATELLRSYGLKMELVAWKNPVHNCFSVHLRLTDYPQVYTNGKGASKLASQASAMFEFFERISTNLFFSDYYLGADTATKDFVFYPNEKWFPVENPTEIPTHCADGTELLNEELRKFYNPEGELTPALLHDNNNDNLELGISALPFDHLDRAETCYFPVSILNNIYVSNGMAAGNTSTECRAQALSEILERHVKNNIIANGICLPDVPQAVLDRYPHIKEGISELRDHGFPVRVKDASLGGKFPVVCVLLVNPENGGCYASFGASCRFEVALERTVTELLQGRDLHQLDVFQLPSHDLDEVADNLNLESHFIDSGGLLSWRMFRHSPDFEFVDWDFQGSTSEEYQRLLEIIVELGYDAYCAEYRHCGVYSCRIIVPGMSEIYPIEDLVWSNRTTSASIRPQLLNLKQMSRNELKDFLEDFVELGLADQQPVSDAIGVLFDEDSVWSTLRVGELKAMISLATGDFGQAAMWCQWYLSFNSLPTLRRSLYRVISDLINFELTGENPTEYRLALEHFYDPALLATAQQIVSGRETFYGLNFADTWEEISPAHAKLLSLHKKLHGVLSKNWDGTEIQY